MVAGVQDHHAPSHPASNLTKRLVTRLRAQSHLQHACSDRGADSGKSREASMVDGVIGAVEPGSFSRQHGGFTHVSMMRAGAW
jgi:hypothetical protein